MLELKNISKNYYKKKTRLTVIQDFSYRFEKGKVYLIKGSSGCGKTTLLSIIGLLDNSDTGEIIFDDRVINKLNNILHSQKF